MPLNRDTVHPSAPAARRVRPRGAVTLSIVALVPGIAGCAGGSDGESASRCDDGAPTTTVQHEVSGRSYTADVFVPASAPATGRVVVIDLHGLASDGPSQAALSRLRPLAEAEGFVVVEPTGQPGPLDGATGWEVAPLDEPDRDDDRYLTELIATVTNDHCADPSRVHLVGYSNGAMFATEYACRHAGSVAAVVAVAGVSSPPGCSTPFAMLAVHGTADPIVPYETDGASLLIDDSTPPAVVDYLTVGVTASIDAAAARSACDPEPSSEAVADGVVRREWHGCESGAEVVAYVIDGGGHTWPGAPEQPDAAMLGTTSSFDGSTAIWDFLDDRHA